MPNYKNSKIYMLWSPSNPNLIYIGSTTQSLALRMGQHRSKYKRYLNGTCKTNYSSFRVLECGDARIELIECVECKDRKELCRIEGKYIRERECVNKQISGRTKNEYYQDNKEKRQEYGRRYGRQYRQDNKQKKKEYEQQYHQTHKQKIEAKRSVKTNCPCGSTIRKDSLPRHRRTKKHKQYIAHQQKGVVGGV